MGTQFVCAVSWTLAIYASISLSTQSTGRGVSMLLLIATLIVAFCCHMHTAYQFARWRGAQKQEAHDSVTALLVSACVAVSVFTGYRAGWWAALIEFGRVKINVKFLEEPAEQQIPNNAPSSARPKLSRRVK
jgi:hypothetical protein